MGLLKDSTAKVDLISELDKLKAAKRLTACRCKIDGCENIGRWSNKYQNFYLLKGMCNVHFLKFKKYGNPLAGQTKENIEDGRTSCQLYYTWHTLRSRITNTKDKKYPRYGGRGLKMEESWIPNITGFWQFLKDIEYLGYRPKGYTLDRKNNELGYFVGNLRWASAHQQSANQRKNNKTVGVCWHKASKKWHAELTFKKIKVLSAFFDKYEDAVKSRKDAEKQFEITY